jgi:hypothetical protein
VDRKLRHRLQRGRRFSRRAHGAVWNTPNVLARFFPRVAGYVSSFAFGSTPKMLILSCFPRSVGHFRGWLDDLFRDSYLACLDADVLIEVRVPFFFVIFFEGAFLGSMLILFPSSYFPLALYPFDSRRLLWLGFT